MIMAQSNMKQAANAPEKMIHIDGRTLEGGGQLVRNAVALSALTGNPITVSHIRGNRQGRTGLKGSHAAAIQFIADICQGEVIGGHVGSQSMTFYPRKRELYDHDSNRLESSLPPGSPLQFKFSTMGLPVAVKPEYYIQQHTAGSISLVFQALYPYLVYASSLSSIAERRRQPIRVNITGGTNVTHSPSFEYLDQVLVPNLLKCGLPKLFVSLHKRGWSTGPRDLGAVTFYIHPLEKLAETGDRTEKSGVWFPDLKLGQYRRTTVTGVDITILAPDIDLKHQDAQGNRQARRKAAAARKIERWDDQETVRHQSMTIREYLEEKSQRVLRRTKGIFDENSASGTGHSSVETGMVVDGDRSRWEESESRKPIQIRLSEATNHHTHIYILLVAHMSNGFTIGCDALFNGYAKRGSGRRHDGSGDDMIATLDGLVEGCVDGLVEEVRGTDGNGTTHRPCVDVHMRDQLVIFEALGLLGRSANNKELELENQHREDDRYWSLHTQTARWVCEQILGEVWAKTRS